MEKIPYILVGLFSVFIASLSQILLKKSALQTYENIWREYLNPKVVAAYALLFVTTILGMISYKGISVSMGLVIETTSYIYLSIFSVKIFHEKITVRKLLALSLIVGGIIVYAISG